MRDLAPNHLFGPVRLLATRRRSVQDVQTVGNRCERVTKLVGKHRQELVLPAIALGQTEIGGPELLLGALALGDVGLNSRAVVIGDKTQIDLPTREESGLIQIERILPGVAGVAFCYLEERDVVRHRLVREIIRAYSEDQGG